MRPPALSLVVPAFNEAARISQTINDIRKEIDRVAGDAELIVVDDGSRDQTATIVAEAARKDIRIKLVRAPHAGKGAAVRRGMLEAKGAWRFLADADLSMPIREVERFLPPHVSGADIAIATREGAGARRVGEPARRHLVGRMFNTLVQWLLLPGLEDTQCGFKMFTRTAAECVFPRLRVDGWSFDIEALYLARRDGLRVVEVPIEWHYRAESRLNIWRDGAAMFVALGLWAIARFVVGFTWRDSTVLGPLRAEQLYALVVLAIAVVGLVDRWRAPLATGVERRPEGEARLA